MRFLARLLNPAVLRIAGRGWMPIVGVLRHQGRRSGRLYATPLGMRPSADAFVMPRTFSENSDWYRNVEAAGWAIVTYRGRDYTVVDPRVIDYTAASEAFPSYELFLFRLIGINEYLRMRQAAPGWSPPTAVAPARARA